MPNYQEGKIYKVSNTVNDEIYIGSKTRKLSQRMAEHRKTGNIKRHEHLPIYKAFMEFSVENFFIELIEKCPCNDKEELRKKEGEYIRQLKPSLNMIIAGRTCKEYYIDNKECIREQHKDWRENNNQKVKEYKENNKEAIRAYKSEQITCECGCDVTRNHLARHKRSAKHNQLMNDLINYVN